MPASTRERLIALDCKEQLTGGDLRSHAGYLFENPYMDSRIDSWMADLRRNKMASLSAVNVVKQDGASSLGIILMSVSADM